MPPRTDPEGIIFPGAKIRCVLAHDHVLLRQGLCRLLEDEPDIDVVSEAGNAAECLRKVYEFRPDVVVADIDTFGLPASEVELCVSRESFHTKVVFLSMNDESERPLAGVAGGCAVRRTSAEELVEMVRRTCNADGAPADDAVAAIAERRPMETQQPEQHALTSREREVLKLLAQGKTVRTAASVLGLSSKTVDCHKFNLMRKLGIHNKAELVMWAIQKNVVKVPVNF